MRNSAKRLLNRAFADPVARLLARTGVTPNALTVIGLVLSIAAAALLGLGHLFAGGVALLVAGLFDMLDGALARVSGRVTRFGALLDSTVDRVAEAVVFLGLAWYFLKRSEEIGVVVVYVALVGSILVSYVRARAEGLGIPGDVGIAARPERVVLLALGLLTGLVTPALALVALLAFITAGQRLAYASRRAREPEPSAEGKRL